MIDPNVLATLPNNTVMSGSMSAASLPQLEELRKALTAGQTYNIQDQSGGQALRLQSLDATMQSMIQTNDHFRLLNRLAKPSAGGTVDEWTEQSGVGGFLGGSTNTETGDIPEASGVYTRRVGVVKFLMTRRQVSFVLTLNAAIAEAEAIEQANGALQLLTDAEYLLFEGDSSVVPTEWDGIAKQMTDFGRAANILDMRGTPLTSQQPIVHAATTIASYGNFGKPTDLFLSPMAQADLDNSLDPAFRVPLPSVPNGGVSLGAPVVGIRTSWGSIATQPDVFIRDENLQVPMSVTDPVRVAQTANAALKGNASVAITATQSGAVAGSKWAAAHVGWYAYKVAAVGSVGESALIDGDTAAQITQPGDKLTVTITNGTAAATGWAIYRSYKCASEAEAEAVTADNMRLVKRIPITATTTTFNDLNADIPGCSKGYVLNLSPEAHSLTWRQLLPMSRFNLYPTVSAVIPWAQLLFGYLRISKRPHVVMIKNILPNGVAWRPFG